MLILSQLLGFAYIVVMIYFAVGFRKARRKIKHRDIVKNHSDFSVIIPFRNEEKSIPILLKSLNALDRPVFSKVKFIFVDDHSDDNSVQILENSLKSFTYDFEILKNEGTGKKSALNTGINKAQSKWIVTTDADVECVKTWLTELEKAIATTKAQMLVMPIQLQSDNRFFDDLQKLESAALVTMSAGALANGKVFSANGANLAFTKYIFEKAGGYSPEIQLASGDDEFLLKRVFEMDKELVEVYFVPEVMVLTNPCKSLTELVEQRTRWISKVNPQKISWKQFPVIIPALFMLTFIISIPYSLFTPYNLTSSGLLIDKWFGDLILFSSFASFFRMSVKDLLQNLLLIVVMPFYQLLYMVPAFYKRFFGRYSWKGRSYGA
ncbi:MAG: glycosyltransferase [Bacteroidetes bacterium]|nr:glycosyltransferase [Bacteroidota bacterium]